MTVTMTPPRCEQSSLTDWAPLHTRLLEMMSSPIMPAKPSVLCTTVLHVLSGRFQAMPLWQPHRKQKPPPSGIGHFTFPILSLLCASEILYSLSLKSSGYFFHFVFYCQPTPASATVFIVKGFFVRESGLEIVFFQPVKFVISFSACLGHFSRKFSFQHCPLLGNVCFPLDIWKHPSLSFCFISITIPNVQMYFAFSFSFNLLVIHRFSLVFAFGLLSFWKFSAITFKFFYATASL